MKRLGHICIALAGLVLSAVVVMTATTSMPADAAERCLRIIRQGDIETLVNSCNTCRVAALIRSRPGSEVPDSRRYDVLPKSTFPVPFRGPGSTRITSDYPCPGEKGGDKDLLNQKADAAPADGKPECVSLEQAQGVGVVLVNKCGKCRAVAIERFSADGTGRARAYLTLAAGSRAPVAANGFARVGLLAEIACPE